LIATREANLYAYAQVGVTPPQNFHLLPWQDWCSETTHSAKQENLVPGLRAYGHLLPAATILMAVSSSPDVRKIIVSRASPVSIAAMTEMWPWMFRWADRVVGSLTLDQRVRILRDEGRAHGAALYYDDDDFICSEVATLGESWRVVNTEGWGR
jgi:hypothetical protein